MNRRFFRWSSGDGQLVHLHSRFAYEAPLNVTEAAFVVCFLTPAAILVTTVLGNESTEGNNGVCTSNATCSGGIVFLLVLVLVIAPPLGVLFAEIIADVFRHVVVARYARLPELTGLSRVLAAAESSLLVAVLEAGRLWGALSRGGIGEGLASLGRRFEWFCHRFEGAKEEEMSRARWKRVVHVMVAVVFTSRALGRFLCCWHLALSRQDPN